MVENLIETAVRREHARQLMRSNPRAAQHLLSRMGIDAVELQRYQTLIQLKLDDEFMKFQNRFFPELLELGGEQRAAFMKEHNIFGIVADKSFDLNRSCIVTYCLIAPANRALGTPRIKRALRLRFKFVPNPNKEATDRILLQMETQDVPVPKNVVVEFKKDGVS